MVPKLKFGEISIKVVAEEGSLNLPKSTTTLFWRFHKIAKTYYWLRHVCPSVRPHGTTRLPLDGFSRNLIILYFSKIYEENAI
jgi:hypothetical protein